MFEFKNDNLDDRAKFANAIFKLIYIKNGNCIDTSIQECLDTGIFDYLHEHIRNIYELITIGRQIPLMAVYELRSSDANDYCMDECDFEKFVAASEHACEVFYGDV